MAERAIEDDLVDEDESNVETAINRMTEVLEHLQPLRVTDLVGHDEHAEKQAQELFRDFLEYSLKTNGLQEGPEEPINREVYGLYNIGNALRNIGDELDRDDALQRIVSEIHPDISFRDEFMAIAAALFQESLSRRSYVRFVALLRIFVILVVKKASVPLDIFKNGMRAFILIWKNPTLVRQSLNIKESHQSPVESSTSDTETFEIDNESLSLYLKALRYGEEEKRHIRLMVVGMYGVGKTSVVTNILEEETSQIESTEGIDVYVNQCWVDENGKWVSFGLDNLSSTDYTNRLKRVLKNTQSVDPQENSAANKTPTGNETNQNENEEVIYQRVSKADKDSQISTQSSSEQDVLLILKQVLESFKADNDPILLDFANQIMEAKCKSQTESRIEDPPTTISIWDFAGQYIYYSSHHFFLNARSVYLLVMNLSLDLNSTFVQQKDIPGPRNMPEGFTCLEAFKFWLRSIHTYNGPENEGSIQPNVILVGTFRDEITDVPEEKKEEYKETYFNKALESFIGTPILKHVHPKKFLVNNNELSAIFEDLKDTVLEIAKTQNYWNQRVPARWIPLERTIDIMKAEGKEMVSFDEFNEAQKQNEYPIREREELQFFLKFQHALGNMLYFDTEFLRESIILSPQWIIDAFRCFVSHFPDKDPQQLDLWKEYEELAILRPDLMDAIIAGNKRKNYFADYKQEVIKYMEHLDIMAKPSVFVEEEETQVKECDYNTEVKVLDASVDNISSTNECQGESSESLQSEEPLKETLDFHIVPCMLQARPSRAELMSFIRPSNTVTTPVLCLMFNNGFMPPAVFHRLLATCIRKWPVTRHNQTILLYNGLAVFDLTPVSTLTLWFNDSSIFARIQLYSTRKKNIASDLCVEVREFVERMLLKIMGIHQSSFKTLAEHKPFDEYIQCENMLLSSDGLFKVSDLLKFDEIKCTAHSQAHTITKEMALDLWFEDKSQVCGSVDVTDGQIHREPTELELSRLSLRIGHEHRRLGYRLGMTKARMEQIAEEMPHLVSDQITAMLIEWKRNAVDRSLSVLRTALKEVDVDPQVFYDVFFKKDN